MNFKFDFIRKLGSFNVLPITGTLREKCPYSEFFWSVFSTIRTEYGPEKIQIRTLHAVQKRGRLSYYKLGQVLQSRESITKWVNYYQVGQYNLLGNRQFPPENS